jgi:hypothetical protein
VNVGKLRRGYYTLEEGREILRDLKRYAEWAEEILSRRPA